MLAEVDGHPVAVQDGRLLAVAFHTELTDDSRLHARFVAMVSSFIYDRPAMGIAR